MARQISRVLLLTSPECFAHVSNSTSWCHAVTACARLLIISGLRQRAPGGEFARHLSKFGFDPRQTVGPVKSVDEVHELRRGRAMNRICELTSFIGIATTLQTEIAQSRVLIRPPPERPVIFSLRFLDGKIVDRGVPEPHQAMLIKLPILIAV